jgi:hypothetical protein
MNVRARRLIAEGMWMETKQVTICLDGRTPGVVLPPALTHSSKVSLVYDDGVGFDDEGIRATLSFQGQPMATFVPWDAVYQVSSDSGQMIFIEAIPLVDLLAEGDDGARKSPPWLTLVP